MSRNGSKQSREKARFSGLLSMACFAFAKAILACDDVIWRVLVPVRAVCFSALSCAVSKPAKSKTWLVNLAAFAQDFFKGCAILRPRNNCVRFQPGLFCKLNGNVSFPGYQYFSGDGLIALLFLLRCPSAIVWRVRAIVVNAFDGRTRRARPHVLQEVFKTKQLCHPSLTNSDASSPVVCIRPVVWVSAPFFHGLKANIFRHLCASHTAHFIAT